MSASINHSPTRGSSPISPRHIPHTMLVRAWVKEHESKRGVVHATEFVLIPSGQPITDYLTEHLPRYAPARGYELVAGPINPEAIRRIL